jgi:mono/diheme cytochrome c family protein
MSSTVVKVLLLLAASSLCAQDKKPAEVKVSAPAYQPVPVTEARRPNPVKPTPESIASGKKIFGFDCVQCHGVAGDGKGNVPKDLKIPDLTNPATLRDFTDGALFYRIRNGHGGMPPEGDRVQTNQLWDLVNYVRSLAPAPVEKSK